MKKTLILMRHAKTEQAAFGQNDFDRALLTQGENDAQLVGKNLLKKKKHPDLIISSSAKRTQQTAEIISRMFQLKPNQLQLNQELYLCAAHTIEHTVMSLPNEINTCMIIAHNPGISEFIFESNRKAISNEIPTSGIVVFSFKTNNWDTYLDIKKEIEHIDFPKKHQ